MAGPGGSNLGPLSGQLTFGEAEGMTRKVFGKTRRSYPAPRRDVLGGLLSSGTGLVPARNPEVVEAVVQGMYGQNPLSSGDWNPFLYPEGIDRFERMKVRVDPSLPVLGSHFDFDLPGDPAETKRLGKFIDSVRMSEKYANIKTEVKPVARVLERYLPYMDVIFRLGLENGPGLPKVNMRYPILAALMSEGLLSVPKSATVTSAGHQGKMSEKVSRVIVGGRKAQQGLNLGFFGATGPQLAEAMPYTNLFAQSIGMRANPRKGLLGPELFSETSAFRPLARLFGEVQRNMDVRSASGYAGEATAEFLEKAGTESVRAQQAARRDPEKTMLKVVRALRSSVGPEVYERISEPIDFSGDPRRITVELIQRARETGHEEAAIKATQSVMGTQKVKPRSPTRFHSATKELAHDKVAKKILASEIKAAEKAGFTLKPKYRGPGGAMALITLAAILSTGISAMGGSWEESA